MTTCGWCGVELYRGVIHRRWCPDSRQSEATVRCDRCNRRSDPRGVLRIGREWVCDRCQVRIAAGDMPVGGSTEDRSEGGRDAG